ncbi:MAG: tryptophan--tRNA ligase [Rickettsiales bacterium]|jgi:tryptophanyl-tRNA synthetase|nr:tryptophan--tRNA ligase [Rickettsiales bacterium]
MTEKIILTGIKPTGTPHMGNYVGALKPLVEMARDNKTFMFIADLHSLNTMRDPALIKKHSLEIAAILVALGLDLNNAVLFRQSDVREVAELSNFLMNLTPKGLMNRAHSYKAAVDKNSAAGLDPDAGINMGLYTYPVLMAADILLYNSDLVPVGKDQKQHVEFARDIAEYFNRAYGEILKLPEPVIGEETGIIPGLDGRKMSKSYDNVIPLFAPEAELKKKIGRIITDSLEPSAPKNPDESTIFQLYKHFASAAEIADLREKFLAGGLGYGAAKQILFDKINSALADARSEFERLMANPVELEEILANGAARARIVAAETLARVKKAMLG